MAPRLNPGLMLHPGWPLYPVCLSTFHAEIPTRQGNRFCAEPRMFEPAFADCLRSVFGSDSGDQRTASPNPSVLLEPVHESLLNRPRDDRLLQDRDPVV